MPEEPGLLEERLANFRIGVSHAHRGDAADEVEIPFAVRIPHVRTLAAHQRDRLRPVILEEDRLRALDELLVRHGGAV